MIPTKALAKKKELPTTGNCLGGERERESGQKKSRIRNVIPNQ